MTSLPHASGWPHRQPRLEPEVQPGSPSSSRSSSHRKGAFPPAPKSVRMWEVPSQSPDAPHQSAPPTPTGRPSVRLSKRAIWTAGALLAAAAAALIAWLFVSQLI
jgi:hypothetical protein